MSILSAEVDSVAHANGQPQSLKELRDVASPQDSFYLTPGNGGFCAYPIRPLGIPHFSLSDFFPLEAQKLPAIFGKPTALPAPPEVSFDAAIYEPYSDQVFVPEVRSLNWYLVGGAHDYHTFIQGIVEYTQSLLEEWRADPWQFLNKEWEAPEPSSNFSFQIPSTLEAWSAMAPFLDWLSQMDPALFADLQGRLQYRSEIPDHECQALGDDAVYAYYTPTTDQILLMPLAIRLMQEKDYPGVAQILAHEVAHRKNSQAGLVIPSDQLLQRSLDLFFHSAGEEIPLFGMVTGIFGPALRQELSCRRLPFLLEEEIDAHSKDLDYARSQPFLVQSEKMHQESVESLVWYLEQLDARFPSAWRTLAANYVRLAQANHEQSKYLRQP
ncbi:MAG TPA: hypothetical protein VJP40_07595 [bacterium]|nr:hypothetical protein [bacterium]